MQVNRCNLCKTGEELAYHILMHCNRSKQLWDMLLALFSAMVFPFSVKDLLLGGLISSERRFGC